MEVFRSLTSLFVKPECYEIFFEDFNFFHVLCLKATISKLLGYGIVLGAMMVKVPQIQKIVKSGNAIGISFTSLLLELFAITSMLCYSYAKDFPFSTWGDSFFLMIQVVIICFLVLNYNGKKYIAFSFVIGYFSLLFALTSRITPITVLAALQAGNIPAVVIAKLIQAAECVKNGHTGQLSAITFFLTFFGALARIFTSIQETGDNIVIFTYCVSSTVNGIISFQILWYWKATEDYLNLEAKKKN